MANDQTTNTPASKPPDDLVLKEVDDKNFVTEELAGMKKIIHRSLAGWFILLGVISIFWLIKLWPSTPPDRHLDAKLDSLSVRIEHLSQKGSDSSKTVIDTTHAAASHEATDQTFLLIALLAGILGGIVHGLSSLMDFRGNRRLFQSWSLWYFCSPLLGGMIALIMFFVVRAGLFPDTSATYALNPYGVAAISALAGLFTEKALTKLSEVLDTLIPTKETRGGQLDPKSPGDK
jgi:hypothetical protein